MKDLCEQMFKQCREPVSHSIIPTYIRRNVSSSEYASTVTKSPDTVQFSSCLYKPADDKIQDVPADIRRTRRE